MPVTEVAAGTAPGFASGGDLDPVELADRPQHARRVADRDDAGRQVARDHGARADDGVVADRHPGQTIPPPPSQTLSPSVIGAPDSQPARRAAGSTGWVAVRSCMRPART